MSEAADTPVICSDTEADCCVQTSSDTLPPDDHTPSPTRADNVALEDSCQNPEPPKELAELLNADNIGGTVFSKHWLFSTLMRLLEVVFSVLYCRDVVRWGLFSFY